MDIKVEQLSAVLEMNSNLLVSKINALFDDIHVEDKNSVLTREEAKRVIDAITKQQVSVDKGIDEEQGVFVGNEESIHPADVVETPFDPNAEEQPSPNQGTKPDNTAVHPADFVETPFVPSETPNNAPTSNTPAETTYQHPYDVVEEPYIPNNNNGGGSDDDYFTSRIPQPNDMPFVPFVPTEQGSTYYGGTYQEQATQELLRQQIAEQARQNNDVVERVQNAARARQEAIDNNQGFGSSGIDFSSNRDHTHTNDSLINNNDGAPDLSASTVVVNYPNNNFFEDGQSNLNRYLRREPNLQNENFSNTYHRSDVESRVITQSYTQRQRINDLMLQEREKMGASTPFAPDFRSNVNYGVQNARDRVSKGLGQFAAIVPQQVVGTLKQQAHSDDNLRKVRDVKDVVVGVSAMAGFVAMGGITTPVKNWGQNFALTGNKIANAGRYVMGKETVTRAKEAYTLKQVQNKINQEFGGASIKALKAERKELLGLQKKGQILTSAQAARLASLEGKIQGIKTLSNQKESLLSLKNQKAKIGTMMNAFLREMNQDAQDDSLGLLVKVNNMAGNRHIRAVLKYAAKSGRYVFKTAYKATKSGALYVARKTGLDKLVIETNKKLLHTKPILKFNDLKLRTQKAINGGLYNKAKAKLKTKVPTKIQTAAKRTVGVGKKVGTSFKNVGKGAKKAGKVIAAPAKFIKKAASKISAALTAIKGFLLKVVGIAALVLALFIIIIQCIAIPLTQIMSFDLNLKPNLIPFVQMVNESEKDFRKEIESAVKDGKVDGKTYDRIIYDYTNGEVTNNMREIISMAAVFFDNDLEHAKNSSVKKYIDNLYRNSHAVFYYPSEMYPCVAGCSTRNYKCTEPGHATYNESACIEIQYCDGCKTKIVTCEGCVEETIYCSGCSTKTQQCAGADCEKFLGIFPYCPGHEVPTCDGHISKSCTTHEEVYCPGHVEYDCQGKHTEPYCPGTHQDMTINIVVDSWDDIFVRDSYGRKNGIAFTEVKYVDWLGRDDTDRKDGFTYWDQGSKDWAKTLYEQDWKELYIGGNLVPVGNKVVPMTPQEIDAFMQEMSRNTTNVRQLSYARFKLLRTLLYAVGEVPYYENGRYTFGKELGGDAPMPDRYGNDKVGLDEIGLLQYAYLNSLSDTKEVMHKFDDANSLTDVWYRTYAIEKDEMEPGDIGFMNSCEVGPDGKRIPVNYIGIFAGKCDNGSGVWIVIDEEYGSVTTICTEAFNYYRRVDGLEINGYGETWEEVKSYLEAFFGL